MDLQWDLIEFTCQQTISILLTELQCSIYLYVLLSNYLYCRKFLFFFIKQFFYYTTFLSSSIKIKFFLKVFLSYLYGREGYLMVRFLLHLNPQDSPIKAEPVTAGSRNTQSAVRSISAPIASTIAPAT